MILRGNVACDIAQTDLSAVAKVQARLASQTIQRDEPRIQSGFENSPAAGFRLRSRCVEPCRNAAIDQPIAVVSSDLNHRIVDPALLSRFRVDYKHTIERRGQVQ